MDIIEYDTPTKYNTWGDWVLLHTRYDMGDGWVNAGPDCVTSFRLGSAS